MRNLRVCGFLVAIILFTTTHSASASDPYTFQHGNVLGTNLELRLNSTTPDGARAAESGALSEIDRLAAVLSSYDPKSELSQWVDASQPMTVSTELRDMLWASEKWHAESAGAFNPGVELASRLWKTTEKAQKVPTDKELAATADELNLLPWQWSNDRSQVSAIANHPISFNAIAKGYIIDRVTQKLATCDGITGGLIAIGGDMRSFGDFSKSVPIRGPEADLSAPMLSKIKLNNRAMATSSGAFRGVTINGVRFSHIIDPRTARPVTETKSVSVIATTAADADALATACSVMPINEAIALIERTPDAAALMVDSRGDVLRSSRWSDLEQVDVKLVHYAAADSDWNGGMELKVDFTIHQADSGGRYRRPYVAVWVEDKDNFPVKTLVLWVQSTGPGPRWIPDLRRWYKSDRLRKLADETDLVSTVSEATRKPGAYSVTWKGEDDNKKLVQPGEYTLYIEAAREHGTYQLIRKKLTLGTDGFKEKLEENVEIKGATIEYAKKAVAK